VYSQLISSTSLIPTLLHNLFNVTIRVHKLCSLLFTVLFPVCFDHFATIMLGISGDYRKHLHMMFSKPPCVTISVSNNCPHDYRECIRTCWVENNLHNKSVKICTATNFFLALQPSADYGLPVHEVSLISHSRQDSSERVFSSSQRPLPENTQHTQQTNIRAPSGIFFCTTVERFDRL
jgi:hypothetical protein